MPKMSATELPTIVPPARIERSILVLRGHKVILDVELAELFGVPTKALNQAVKRNASRFPPDFMFPLTAEEKREVVTICDHLPGLKFSRTLPKAFTEHGALMAANVLNSEQAVAMSVHIVRAFVRLREAALNYDELNKRLREAESRLDEHDIHLAGALRRIRELTEAPRPAPRPRRIGFRGTDDA